MTWAEKVQHRRELEAFARGRADALADPTDREVHQAVRKLARDVGGLDPDGLDVQETVELRLVARAAIAGFLAVRRGSE